MKLLAPVAPRGASRLSDAFRQLTAREKCFAFCSLAAYFSCCLFLYYQQAVGLAWDDSYPYLSDLPIQLGEAFDGFGGANNYSLNSVVYYLLHLLYPRNPFPIAVFLAAVSAAAIPAALLLLQKLAPGASLRRLFLFAWLVCFSMAVYIPGAGNLYIGTFSGALWHNHTYTVLRPFAILSVYYFLDIAGCAETRRPGRRSFFFFALFFTAATWIKPSFFITFAPAVGVFLLFRLIRNRGAGFSRVFAAACCFLPSAVIVAAQSALMFGGGRTGFVLAVSNYFSVISFPVLSLLRSLLFVLLATALFGNIFRRLPLAAPLWGSFGFAAAELIFLKEVGERETHYNMIWGVHLAVFFLFLYAAAALLRAASDLPCRQADAAGKAKRFAVFAALLIHAAGGAAYFILLLLGHQYSVI